MSQLDVLKGDLDPLTKRIVFMAILTTELEKEGFSPVAGGDYAIELYTQGNFKSGKIEIFAPIDVLDKVLLEWGFDKVNGFLRNDEFDITVRLLAEELSQSELDRVNQVDVNGFPVYILGLEDTIVAKLKDVVYHQESSASSWIQDLVEIHVNEINYDYLEKRSFEEGVLDTLQEILDKVGFDSRNFYVREE